jgi:hypothetical protein
MSNKGFKDFFKEAEQQLSEFAGAAQRILLPKIKPRPRPKPMPDQPKPGEAPTRPEKEVPGKPIPPKPVEPVPEPKPVPDQKPVPKPIVPIAPLPDSSPKPNVEPESKPKTQPSPIPVPPGETKSGETKPTPIAPLPIPIDQEQGKKLDFWRWGRAPAGEPVGPYRSDKEMGYVKEFKNMTDIQKSLYIIETMSTAEKHPTGPKFPGYWKGTDPASAAKDRMVGGSEEQQESVLGELDKTAKDTAIRRTLEEKYKAFKEQDDQTKSLEGPVNIYPKMFPKRPATPTTMDPKDIDPAAIAMLVPGTIGLGAQGLTYSPELAPGTIYPPGQNPYSTPATKSDHLAAIRKADADAARQQSAPAASKTVPKAPATASGPLIRPDDESAAEKARLQRPSVNAPVSTPQPQKVAPTVSEPAGSAAKTQPNVEPAVPTDQGPVGYQGLDPSGRKTATTDPRSSTFGCTICR